MFDGLRTLANLDDEPNSVRCLDKNETTHAESTVGLPPVMNAYQTYPLPTEWATGRFLMRSPKIRFARKQGSNPAWPTTCCLTPLTLRKIRSSANTLGVEQDAAIPTSTTDTDRRMDSHDPTVNTTKNRRTLVGVMVLGFALPKHSVDHPKAHLNSASKTASQTPTWATPPNGPETTAGLTKLIRQRRWASPEANVRCRRFTISYH